MIDIEVLRIIWWGLLGIVLIGFAVTDGFDFGAAILYPFIAKNESERRVVLNCITPFWEGNQVWIILGAGAIFAAWPYVYAVAFSGLYFILLLLLLTMGISRPVSFKYRDKLPQHRWRRFWDHLVFIGGIVPALLFGLLIGNILLGVPFYFDRTLRLFYTGGFFQLFSPFALWCAMTSMLLLIMHGAAYLAVKTEDPIRFRALRWTKYMAMLVIIFFVNGGVWIAKGIHGYWIVSGANHFAPSNPLHKVVATSVGGWLRNYAIYPSSVFFPIMGVIGAMGVVAFAQLGYDRLCLIASGLSITGIIATVGVSMFPFLLPSSSNIHHSLVIWDASATQLALLVMLITTIIFLPIIIAYTSWVYHAMRGKVRPECVK